MRLREQRLWDRMRSHLPPDVRAERVENAAGDGFPDVLLKSRWSPLVWGCELKAVDVLPLRASTRVFGDEGLRQSQKNWMVDWYNYNGCGIIVCSVGRAEGLFHWAIPGNLGDVFNSMTLADLRRETVVKAEEGSQFWPAFYKHVGSREMNR